MWEPSFVIDFEHDRWLDRMVDLVILYGFLSFN